MDEINESMRIMNGIKESTTIMNLHDSFQEIHFSSGINNSHG